MRTNISDQILWLEQTKSNIPVGLLSVTPNITSTTSSIETDAKKADNVLMMANLSSTQTPQLNKSNTQFSASSSLKSNGGSSSSNLFQSSPFADQFPMRTSGNLLSLNSPLSKFLTSFSPPFYIFTNENMKIHSTAHLR